MLFFSPCWINQWPIGALLYHIIVYYQPILTRPRVPRCRPGATGETSTSGWIYYQTTSRTMTWALVFKYFFVDEYCFIELANIWSWSQHYLYESANALKRSWLWMSILYLGKNWSPILLKSILPLWKTTIDCTSDYVKLFPYINTARHWCFYNFSTILYIIVTVHKGTVWIWWLCLPAGDAAAAPPAIKTFIGQSYCVRKVLSFQYSAVPLAIYFYYLLFPLLFPIYLSFFLIWMMQYYACLC